MHSRHFRVLCLALLMDGHLVSCALLVPIPYVCVQMNTNPLSFLFRLLLGTAAGFYYFLVSDC